MKKIIIAAGAALMLASCSQNKGWKVEGRVEGASDKDTLYVEEAVYDNWHAVDTIALASGEFQYAAPEAAGAPSVYRLRLGDRCIYFPVDSIETVTISANKARFDRGYHLAGSRTAAGFMRVDSLVNAAVDSQGVDGALANKQLKRELNVMVNQDSTCLLSYYIVGKTVEGKPLYNLSDKDDLRVLANAANNFARLRPSDPRAGQLTRRWTEARKALGQAGPGVAVNAAIVNRPPVKIQYHDMQGNLHDFDKIADRGGVTVLNFTRYDGANSQANTVALNDVYQQYKGQGLEIYQIGYDPDEHEWRRSAKNMPWIAVYAPANDDNQVLVSYNVDPIYGNPVSFVFNRKGELVERVTDPSKLATAVAKVL